MDKLVINAVAGSGKTSLLIDHLDLKKNTVIITYTTANQQSIREKTIKKFGFIPTNIHIFGVFEFLYSFCYLPLQNEFRNKGICFDASSYTNTNYHTKDGRIFANKLSKYILIKKLCYLERINRYFDKLYIDEMQDFGSYDFDWMMTLSKLNIPVTLVGDFYQHTFSTSRIGNKGKSLHSDQTQYKQNLESHGFYYDSHTLSNSHRCTYTVCQFIKTHLHIDISSHRDKLSDNSNVRFIDHPEQIYKILTDNNIVKLFFQKHYNFKGNSDNWGNSKGLTFKSACVVMNPTTLQLFKKNSLTELAPLTLCKFYVACSRTEGDLYFIDSKKIPKDFYK